LFKPIPCIVNKILIHYLYMGSGHKKQGKIADNNEKKSKVFGKLVRLIQVEAKKCGGDITSSGLAAAIAKANKENMPKENIERAIKKASESNDATPVIYEAYGPGGIGMIITGLTDNNNRTSQEIKHALSKNGCSLGASGSVAWNFTLNTERDWQASSTMKIDQENHQKLETIIELLRENDDVQEVYHNAA